LIVFFGREMKASLESRCLAVSKPTPISELLDGPALLARLWPDQTSRPSLRWLRAQQKLKTVPVVRCGRRALFCPSQVLDSIRQRFTVLPQTWVRDGYSVWDLPGFSTLTDARGLLNWLCDQFGLERSLRWLREQQQTRTVPYIKLGARVFFAAEQVRLVWERRDKRCGLGRSAVSSDSCERRRIERQSGRRLVMIQVPWILCSSKIQILNDLHCWA
jgi:hypothetical protein